MVLGDSDLMTWLGWLLICKGTPPGVGKGELITVLLPFWVAGTPWCMRGLTSATVVGTPAMPTGCAAAPAVDVDEEEMTEADTLVVARYEV